MPSPLSDKMMFRFLAGFIFACFLRFRFEAVIAGRDDA